MKRLVVFAGPPASGKSTLGDRLSEDRSMVHLEMDRIREFVLPGSRHTREDREVAYRIMHLMAETLLGLGHEVIVNAGYSHPEDQGAIQEIAKRSGARLFWIECVVPAEVAVQRCRGRFGKHPGLDLTDDRVVDLVTHFPYTGAGLLVDSTEPVDSCLERVESYLDQPE
jgi:predicted kinase